MKLLPEKNLWDDDNPLLKKLTPVILTVAARGYLKSESKTLVMGALVSLFIAPFIWILGVAKRGLHLAIVFGVWWFVRGEIAALGISETTVLVLAFVAVLYRVIYDELLDIIVTLLILITGGGFLRWTASGFLAGDGARQKMFESKALASHIAGHIEALPTEFRNQYDELMGTYLDSENPQSAERLNELLAGHSNDETRM